MLAVFPPRMALFIIFDFAISLKVLCPCLSLYCHRDAQLFSDRIHTNESVTPAPRSYDQPNTLSFFFLVFLGAAAEEELVPANSRHVLTRSSRRDSQVASSSCFRFLWLISASFLAASAPSLA